jgi:hypothetical protein
MASDFSVCPPNDCPKVLTPCFSNRALPIIVQERPTYTLPNYLLPNSRDAGTDRHCRKIRFSLFNVNSTAAIFAKKISLFLYCDQWYYWGKHFRRKIGRKKNKHGTDNLVFFPTESDSF